MASIHADAATRANQGAQQQVRTVIARIDHVLESGDWAEHVERVRKAFDERNGAQSLIDSRADVRLRLLEDDPGMGAAAAELALASLDGAIKVASGGDLNQMAGHMREVMQAALKGFESSEMGRQSIAHGLVEDERGDGIGGGSTGWRVAPAACIAWAWSSFVFSIACCVAIPFCWCCIAPVIAAAAIAHTYACAHFLQPLCDAP